MSGGESNGSGIEATLGAFFATYSYFDSRIYGKLFKNVTRPAERVMPPPGKKSKCLRFQNWFLVDSNWFRAVPYYGSIPNYKFSHVFLLSLF